MNQDLENLIDLALADGVLSEKEMQVLNKKAKELGVDQDEFEMVLEARLHLRNKEGTLLKNKDNVLKCPSCNDIVPGLSKVCPSCGFVLNSGSKSSESEKGLEDLISDIEDNLVEIKSINPPNIFTTLFNHSYISLPILTVILFVIGFRLHGGAGFLGLFLAVISWRLIKKKMGEEKRVDTTPTFNNLKATFEKHSRTANTLFGENKKVKLLLDELKNELVAIEEKRKKGKMTESIFYGILALIIISLFFIPKVESVNQYDLQETQGNQNQVLIDAALEKDNFVEAKRIATQLDEMFTDKEEIIARVYKKEILFNIKNKNFQNAEEVFFTCPENSYHYIRDAAPHIVQAYIENNDEKGAKSFIAKINVEYDGGELQTQLKELLE